MQERLHFDKVDAFDRFAENGQKGSRVQSVFVFCLEHFSDQMVDEDFLVFEGVAELHRLDVLHHLLEAAFALDPAARLFDVVGDRAALFLHLEHLQLIVHPKYWQITRGKQNCKVNSLKLRL